MPNRENERELNRTGHDNDLRFFPSWGWMKFCSICGYWYKIDTTKHATEQTCPQCKRRIDSYLDGYSTAQPSAEKPLDDKLDSLFDVANHTIESTTERHNQQSSVVRWDWIPRLVVSVLLFVVVCVAVILWYIFGK